MSVRESLGKPVSGMHVQLLDAPNDDVKFAQRLLCRGSYETDVRYCVAILRPLIISSDCCQGTQVEVLVQGYGTKILKSCPWSCVSSYQDRSQSCQDRA
jgi:hypothetical protein